MNRRLPPRDVVGIVDSDVSTYGALQALLANRFEFRFATTIESALQMTGGRTILLWLIAARLPDHGAIELCQLISRRQPHGRVAMIGGPEDADQEVACRVAGASWFFCKPVDPAMLAALVRGVAESDYSTGDYAGMDLKSGATGALKLAKLARTRRLTTLSD